jgi:hypothetical protein
VFILGLLLGPAAALAGRDFLVGQLGLRARWALVTFAVLAVALLTIPLVDLELRLGLLIGALVGGLLAATPFKIAEAQEPA